MKWSFVPGKALLLTLQNSYTNNFVSLTTMRRYNYYCSLTVHADAIKINTKLAGGGFTGDAGDDHRIEFARKVRGTCTTYVEFIISIIPLCHFGKRSSLGRRCSRTSNVQRDLETYKFSYLLGEKSLKILRTRHERACSRVRYIQNMRY